MLPSFDFRVRSAIGTGDSCPVGPLAALASVFAVTAPSPEPSSLRAEVSRSLSSPPIACLRSGEVSMLASYALLGLRGRQDLGQHPRGARPVGGR